MDGSAFPYPRIHEGSGSTARYRSLAIGALWLVLQFGGIVALNRAGVPVWQDTPMAAVGP